MSTLDARPRESKRVHAVALLVLQVLLSLLFCWLIYIAPLSTAGCGEACDYSTIAIAANVFFGIVLLAFVGSVVGVALLRHRGWWVIAAPIVSITVVTVAWAVTTSVMNRAMLL